MWYQIGSWLNEVIFGDDCFVRTIRVLMIPLSPHSIDNQPDSYLRQETKFCLLSLRPYYAHELKHDFLNQRTQG